MSSSQAFKQQRALSTQSFWHLASRSRVVHQRALDLLLAHSIVFEWLRGILGIHVRSESVMESELPWEYVFHQV